MIHLLDDPDDRGALVRGRARFVQRTGERQLDLLADVCDPGVAAVRNGYLRSSDIADPAAFAGD
jgi:hypothetical protein